MVKAVEYFFKWPEVEAVPNITAKNMIDFMWGNIICHFRIPKRLNSNEEKQFNCRTFKEFTQNMEI